MRPGYANFAIASPPLKLVLLENPGEGYLNHLGVEVASTEAVEAERARLAGAGLGAAEERDTTCCYARQDKFWVQGAPGGEQWEIYAVLQGQSHVLGPGRPQRRAGHGGAGRSGSAGRRLLLMCRAGQAGPVMAG